MNSLYDPMLVVALFGGMLIFLEIGRQVGRRRGEGAGSAFNALEGAIFGLMGLLLAFTFYGAATRFDAKRQLIVDETNAIDTAYLRIDLLPPSRQESLRESLRRYLDARLAFYRKVLDPGAAAEEASRATAVQREIWTLAVGACREASSPATTTLVLSSLSAMIDVKTTRDVALHTHPPTIIFALLGILLLICSLLGGFDAAAHGSRSPVHMLGFAAVMAITVYVILDYEYPRIGMIRQETTDQSLVELRRQMN
jgi:hypothetical protein